MCVLCPRCSPWRVCRHRCPPAVSWAFLLVVTARWRILSNWLRIMTINSQGSKYTSNSIHWQKIHDQYRWPIRLLSVHLYHSFEDESHFQEVSALDLSCVVDNVLVVEERCLWLSKVYISYACWGWFAIRHINMIEILALLRRLFTDSFHRMLTRG